MANGHISKRTEKQIQRLVNELFMEAYCAGPCGRRLSIHEMEANCETGKFYCGTCCAKREAVGLVAEDRVNAAITQLLHVAAHSA